MQQLNCLPRRQPRITGLSVKVVDLHITECSVLVSPILNSGFEMAVLPSAGLFGNRPQEERGSFKMWALPSDSPNLFNSGFLFLLTFLILSLGTTTTIWEESRFRRSLEKKEHRVRKLGALLVSGMTCKELGSLQFHLHNKNKTEQTGSQQLFLDPSEHWGHRANRCPRNWTDRWIQRISAYQDQKTFQKPIPEKENLNYNWQITRGSV